MDSQAHQIGSKTKILSPNQVNFAPGKKIKQEGNMVGKDVIKDSSPNKLKNIFG